MSQKKRQNYSILLRKVYHKHQYFSMIFNNFSDFYNQNIQFFVKTANNNLIIYLINKKLHDLFSGIDILYLIC